MSIQKLICLVLPCLFLPSDIEMEPPLLNSDALKPLELYIQSNFKVTHQQFCLKIFSISKNRGSKPKKVVCEFYSMETKKYQFQNFFVCFGASYSMQEGTEGSALRIRNKVRLLRVSYEQLYM